MYANVILTIYITNTDATNISCLLGALQRCGQDECCVAPLHVHRQRGIILPTALRLKIYTVCQYIYKYGKQCNRSFYLSSNSILYI